MKNIIAVLLIAGAVFAANEITVNTSVKVNKDAVQLERKSGTQQITMTGDKYHVQVISANTTNQFLSKGSITSAGWCYLRNLSTNTSHEIYVTFDGGATTSIVLLAEEPALFRLAPAAVVTNFTVSANTNAVNFEATIIEK